MHASLLQGARLEREAEPVEASMSEGRDCGWARTAVRVTKAVRIESFMICCLRVLLEISERFW
jgi:hypothetical protein